MRKTVSLLLALLLIFGAATSAIAYSGTAATIALELSGGKSTFAKDETFTLSLVMYNQSFDAVSFLLQFPQDKIALTKTSKGVLGTIFYDEDNNASGLFRSDLDATKRADNATGKIGYTLVLDQNTESTAVSTGTRKYIPASSSGFGVCTISFKALADNTTITKNDFAFLSDTALTNGAKGGNVLVTLGESTTIQTTANLIDLPAGANANTKPARRTGVSASASSSITLPNAYSLNLNTIFADADNDTLSYQIKLDSATAFSNISGSTYTNSALSASTHTLVFRAYDGVAYSTETYTVTLTVNAAPINHAPKLKPGVSNPATASVNTGSAYTLNLADIFTDEDSDNLTYNVSVDSAATASTGAIYTKTWNAAGTHSLSFTANDGSLYSAAYVVNVTVNAAPANSAPTRKIGVSASANAAITLGQTYSLNLADIFTDNDNDTLTYKVKIGSGNAMDAESAYSYKPTIASNYTLVFTACDGKSNLSDTYIVNLTVTPADSSNTAPMVLQSAPTSASIALGESYTIVLSSIFSDAQNDALTYKLRIGSALQSTVVSAPYVFTPTAVGNYVLHFTASDASLTSDEYAIAIAVKMSNADALADAKRSANNELDNYIEDYSKYTYETVMKMKSVISQAKNDIELAVSTDAVSTALVKAKTQIDELAANGATTDANVVRSLFQLVVMMIRQFFAMLKNAVQSASVK